MYSFVKQPVTDQYLRVTGKTHLDAGSDTTIGLQSSALAAPLSSIGCVPSDVIKKRMVLQQPPQPFVATMQQLLRHEGWQGLFRGYKVNLMKDAPVASVKMQSYEVVCKFLYLHRGHTWYPSRQLGAPVNERQKNQSHHRGLYSTQLRDREIMAGGFLSALFTSTVTMPLDVLNTHMKNPEIPLNRRSTVLESMRALYADGGVFRFFRGIVPRTVMFTLGATVFWTVFNHLQQVYIPHVNKLVE